MNATIDIKTPSGQSLKGFPLTTDKLSALDFINLEKVAVCFVESREFKSVKLHKGDRIIIEIEE